MDEVAQTRACIGEVDQHAFVTDIRSMQKVIADSSRSAGAGTLLIALYGVGALDIVAWSGTGVVILTACLAAGYPPAHRAAQNDPMGALQAE